MKESKPKLRIDGMVSGTGVQLRGKANWEDPEEYLDVNSLEIPEKLRQDIILWQQKYAHSFMANSHKDSAVTNLLDQEGIEIARQIANELPQYEVEYFSDAILKIISIE